MEVNRRNRRRTSGYDDGGIQVQIISPCNRSNQQMGYGGEDWVIRWIKNGNCRILVFALCMHNPIFMGALTKIRTCMTNDNSSAFDINKNGLLMIIAISALLAVEVSSVILFFTKIPSKYYTILKFFAIFLASISPFML
ncbi:hypothetical protein HanXRQr2_Chr16g0778251 [Helianthus annuus]|uniref:Uncharacterized protein n=1 Tax=Helianthus annuus TaxID=4232 RepID=A0A9K3DXW5_HELAN|nr:hypothetical protein HanXRQr2_Chr16g0778251 [Helianthus annuus]